MKCLLLLASLAAAPAAAAPQAVPLPPDPLESPFFATAVQLVLGEDARLAFDDRVKVIMPGIAENQREFPVAVDARAIPGVQRIVIFADLNPIQQAIAFRPIDAEAWVATRIKLDQRTPVRAAVQVADGTWRVSGGWVDAAGGGCSAPPVSRVKGDWAQHLGEARGRVWQQGGATRLMLAFRHPMDTGFVDNIPAYHLETLTLTGEGGRLLAQIEMQASVGEDPVIALRPRARPAERIAFAARDTGGIESTGVLAASAMPAIAAR